METFRKAADRIPSLSRQDLAELYRGMLHAYADLLDMHIPLVRENAVLEQCLKELDATERHSTSCKIVRL